MHYPDILGDMALYEKQIGTSKGILTDNETSYTATATAVRRANSDTLALLDKIEELQGRDEVMTMYRYEILSSAGRDEEAVAALISFNEEYPSPRIPKSPSRSTSWTATATPCRRRAFPGMYSSGRGKGRSS